MKERLKELADSMGADLVGVGNVERWHDAPEEYHPCTLLEGARSVVAIAISLPLGHDLSVRHRKSKFPHQYEYHVVNDQLDIIIHTLARFLEKAGYISLAVPAHMPPPDGRDKYYFCHRHAATACGLGEIGWGNQFISRQFGARQRISSLITQAALQPDPLVEESLCTRCMLCVKHCPSNALSLEPDKVVMIEGKVIEVGKIDKDACKIADSGRMGIWCDEEVRDGRQFGTTGKRLAGQGVHWCGNCITYCPLGDFGNKKD